LTRFLASLQAEDLLVAQRLASALADALGGKILMRAQSNTHAGQTATEAGFLTKITSRPK